MKEISRNIYVDGKKIYTKDSAGKMRSWDPEKSKLAAAILNGLTDVKINEESIVLYLGASTGTTTSHVSDIAAKGLVYAVEFSERVFHSLIDLSGKRKNIAPLLADARKPENYAWVEQCDVLYCDIAQPDQTEIAIRNANVFLKKGGFMYIAVKSQSIDVTKQPSRVYKEEAEKMRKGDFEVLQIIDLEPYEEKHAMIVAKLPD